MVSPPVITLPYQERNLLFLEEVLDELQARSIAADFLFRASEVEKLDRILKYGTDRGGFSGQRLWSDGPDIGRELPHEDVIFATTAEEIRLGEADPGRSTSLKKFAIIEQPLFLVYDANHFVRLHDRQFKFREPGNKLSALLAVFQVIKLPPIQGWFSEASGLSYRALVEPIRNGIVVEVGCWKGLSTSYIGRLCMANHTRLYCVDNWSGSSDDYNEAYRHMLAIEDVPVLFLRNMAERGIEVTTLQLPSLEAVGYFADCSLDMVFLDGSHDRTAVAAEAAAWFEKLKPGGILAGHDYNDKHQDVIDAASQFTKERQLALHTSPGDIWWMRK
jgi:predicted O-methyltransferase YrrM